MNRTGFAALALFAVLGCSAFADASVTNVIVRQRWPWSGAVDIDYTLAGSPSDVKFCATWEGQPDPVDISPQVGGEMSSVACGDHHAVWTPAGTLRGVTVSVVPVDGMTERKYLVIDLKTGAHEFLSDVPAGGWTDDHKRTKMVFARIKADTYTLGMTSEEMEATWADGGTYKSLGNVQVNAAKRRRVKVSNDYYMAIYMTTDAQVKAIGGADGNSLIPSYQTTSAIRGPLSDVDWPHTGHDVSPTNLLGVLRAKLNLPRGWLVDLPTSWQFEVAARCGTTSFFPDASLTPETDATVVSNALATSVWWKGHQPVDCGYRSNTDAPVGALAANAWGLYDMIGFRAQLMIEWNNSNVLPSDDAVDPVGPMSSGGGNRMMRSCDTNPSGNVYFASLLPARGATYASQTGTACFRLCVDTRSLIETTSDVISK